MIDGTGLSRRDFLKVLGAAGLGAAVSGCNGMLSGSGGSGAERPNVVVILVDDQGYGDLSCYGGKDVRTPNLDKLIGAGMRMDNFYANCPVCAPTRAALLTGRYPDLVGVPGVIRTNPRNSFGYLDPQAVLLPTVLKGAGYHTACVGKWHLGLEAPNRPNDRGFDHFHGFLGDMMDDYYTHLREGFNYMRLNEEVIEPEGHATELFTDWSVDYLWSRKDKSEPFFLYLAYNAPHEPIQPPAEWLERVKAREKGISEKRAKLVALIEHMDDGVGKIMRALEETGLGRNTLVVYTSDNGGELYVEADNGELNGGKGNMLEGGIKEPFGAVWPGRIEAGGRNGLVVTTMDLFGTICEAAGVEYAGQTEGRSFLPTLLGQEQEWEDRYLFWMRREGWGGEMTGRCYYAARYGDWKLLQNRPDEPFVLYNLKDDPREQKAMGPEDHHMYRKLQHKLQDHIIRSGAIPWRERPVDFGRRRMGKD